MREPGYEVPPLLDITVHTWDCGCWHEHGVNRDTGNLELIRFQACTDCWDAVGRYLDNLDLDRKAQLTLELPSRTATEGKEP